MFLINNDNSKFKIFKNSIFCFVVFQMDKKLKAVELLLINH